MITATLSFAGLTSMFSGWPYIETGNAELALRMVWHTALLLIVPWLLLGMLSLVARKKPALEPLAEIGVIELYAVSVALFALVTGPFESPGWILCIGGSLVGFLLFSQRLVFVGVLTFQLLVCGGALAMSMKLFRLDVLAQVIGVNDDLSRGAVARLSLLSVGFSYITLMLASHIIVRWRKREATFERLSKTDSLTGLTNRRHFVALVEHEMARTTRYGKPLSLVILDLDHFKLVNDTRGHLAGDAVLVAVGKILTSGIRTLDVACRYGGEEFALLLPETDLEGACELAARLGTALSEQPIDVGEGEPVYATMSIGVAAIPDPATASVDDFIRRADDALYDAKNAGRNRIVAARPTVAA
jgi:diguanylate cyclase (GGDEF)-like protein